MMFPTLNPAQMHQVILVLSAHLSNPNGDPEADNAPRLNPFSNHGIISNASIKRKARDYVQERYAGQPNMEVFIRHGEVMATVANTALRDAGVKVGQSVTFTTDDIATLLDNDLPDALQASETGLVYDGTMKKKEQTALLNRLKDNAVEEDLINRLESLMTTKAERSDREDVQRQAGPVMARRFWDARLFGFTAPDSAGKTRGPVQMTDAESIAPVNIIDQTVTRVARSASSEKDGTSNFGRRSVVDHAVYVATAFVNPRLAAQQGVTEADLTAFLEGLWYGQDVARSSARPDVRVEALVILTHDHPYGNAPYHRLRERLHIEHDGREGVTVTFNDADLDGVHVHIVQ
ncbi:CRISPR-associated protein Csd2 [Deinococcus soli (ex Cha et al. 2016)]|uniref:CRISPR-associated protein Csd2 n=1 Tax=Deinococcus soli (ex Cha et al. 2016) TaxID=1309411 RepID=A0AAE3XEN8_9DEIO|nr:type I CRISPR-associated protein Cas7 [Deinococcus soli (ex Cha et al. 2016)]MDR6219956.1 CRISPR-associated protein Csd2 [Deinococcus soli (ex Cha et al. 2016)]